ncbi:MAG: glucosyltransferase domain-containing protein [Pseudomonadota bacterium]|nr:glucosyltransferase domain-containing protein [Pseudomonadota bacterium]
MELPLSRENAGEAGARRGERDVFGLLLLLYWLILYPLLRADRYYNDDLKRALIGRAGWDSNGRPLTTLLMRMLQCYDHAMVDISPLPQIGAVAILAWAGVLLARRYPIGPAGMAALAAFPLGAQPFFLENLSFKFDALSMSLAMLLAVLPILQLRDGRRAWWLGVLSLFGSLCFYQPAINVYLVFVLVEWVMLQLRPVPPSLLLRRLAWRLLQGGCAMLIYYLVVGIHISGWVKRSSERIHGWRELPLLWRHFVDFYAYVGSSFNVHWWMYFGPLLVMLALFPVAVGIGYARRLRAARWTPATVLFCLAAVLTPLAALIAALGPMLALRQPEIGPRVLMGLGALLAGALVVMAAALRQWRRSPRWALAAGCMLALGMCVLASAYGNAAAAQKKYEDHIASRLADDLARLKSSRGIDAFLLDGSAGDSPVTAHVIGQLPLVRALVPSYLDADRNSFQTPGFLAFYIAGVTNLQANDQVPSPSLLSSLRARACLVPADVVRAAYRIYVVGGTALVRLSGAGAPLHATVEDAAVHCAPSHSHDTARETSP